MSKYKIIGESIPNIPWQERPADAVGPIWRYSENPVIRRNPCENVARIFNSSVATFNGRFVGVFRAETTTGVPYLYLGFSDDALNWDFKGQIHLVGEDGRNADPGYAYDPRLIKIEDTYYIVWCTDFEGASLGIARTKDFVSFERLDNPFLPFNRNGVLFPRRINGMYKMLSRPSDSGHTPFGDIFISESPDMNYWGRHKHVMGKRNSEWWQNVKIGGGCNPIETEVGWLLIYHGVTGTCSGFVYSFGGAILDIDDPSKVLYRSKRYLLTPEMDYEQSGFVPNVTFPCSALTDADTGRMAIYYGSADTYTALAFTTVDTLIDFIMENA